MYFKKRELLNAQNYPVYHWGACLGKFSLEGTDGLGAGRKLCFYVSVLQKHCQF